MKNNIDDDDNEVIQLTPYGLLTLSLDAEDARKAMDALELYMRRNNVGIAIDNNQLSFVNLEKTI